jgi:hypothetical protein
MTDTYQEVSAALDFAVATLGGAQNQGDACNALRGAKLVVHRLEAAHLATVAELAQAKAVPVAAVETPAELAGLVAEGATSAATSAEGAPAPLAPATPTATQVATATAVPVTGEQKSPAKETVLEHVVDEIKSVLGVASETVETA